jgi:hypothetical protein
MRSDARRKKYFQSSFRRRSRPFSARALCSLLCGALTIFHFVGSTIFFLCDMPRPRRDGAVPASSEKYKLNEFLLRKLEQRGCAYLVAIPISLVNEIVSVRQQERLGSAIGYLLQP